MADGADLDQSAYGLRFTLSMFPKAPTNSYLLTHVEHGNVKPSLLGADWYRLKRQARALRRAHRLYWHMGICRRIRPFSGWERKGKVWDERRFW